MPGQKWKALANWQGATSLLAMIYGNSLLGKDLTRLTKFKRNPLIYNAFLVTKLYDQHTKTWEVADVKNEKVGKGDWE